MEIEQVAHFKTLKRALRLGGLMAAIAGCTSLHAAEPDRTSRTEDRVVRTDVNGNGSTTGTTDSANRKDANFIKEAAQGGHMEIKLGQLAADHSQNARVKQFGERLVKDHSAANDELTKLAQMKGVDLTQGAYHAGNSSTKEVDKFSNKSGNDFDKAYIKHMIADHKKDIAKFEKESNQSNDSDVKAFAQKTLPTLREHLQMAEEIGRSLGVDSSSYGDKAVGSAPSTSRSNGSSTDNNQK